jgi:hypothetical protein
VSCRKKDGTEGGSGEGGDEGNVDDEIEAFLSIEDDLEGNLPAFYLLKYDLEGKMTCF